LRQQGKDTAKFRGILMITKNNTLSFAPEKEKPFFKQNPEFKVFVFECLPAHSGCSRFFCNT